MKKVLLMLLLISQLIVAQDISIGVDPKPLFDSSSKGGLDINFSVNVTNSEYEKYGLNGEYFHNLDYASYGIFYDYNILQIDELCYNPLKIYVGAEIHLLSRYNRGVLNLPTGYMGLTGGINSTIRYMFTDKFGVETILNCKYRPDLKFYWDEDKLYSISCRLNLVFKIQ